MMKVSNAEISCLTFNAPVEYLNGVQVQIIGKLFRGFKMRYIFVIPEARRIVRKINPDILIGYRINSYGLLAVGTGWHPNVVLAQGSDIFDKKGSMLRRLNLKYVLKRTDLIHTWEVHMRNKLFEYGADGEKILVLPKGIDTEIFRPLSDQQEKKREPILISTRQLRTTYNHQCILEAVQLVLRKTQSLQYLICGEGDYKNELQRIAEKLGIISAVKFVGRVDHDALPTLLCSADIYVSMQPSDGVSASLLEAMACGVFPIVVDNEANRIWIKDGVNGFLCPVNNHFVLAEKIEEALKCIDLREEAKRMNFEIVRRRASMEANMRTTLRVYEDLVKKVNPRLLISSGNY